jgi:hypothetical protein
LKGTINKEVPSGGMAAFANVEVAASMVAKDSFSLEFARNIIAS